MASQDESDNVQLHTTYVAMPSTSNDTGTPQPNSRLDSFASPSASASNCSTPQQDFTPQEIAKLRKLLQQLDRDDEWIICSKEIDQQLTQETLDSEYSEFAETTHAWAVFADNPTKRATKLDRLVGTVIIFFQLFTYAIFASEAIEDYAKGVVPVMTRHADCLASNESPETNFSCEAEYTNNFDAFIAFFMLSIFLAPDLLQAARVIRDAPFGTPLIFACLAGIEVVCAFIAATISISYQLYIGEATDAVEVGVGLLFIRELSARAHRGIRNKKHKQYKTFFVAVFTLVLLGFLLEPLYGYSFAA